MMEFDRDPVVKTRNRRAGIAHMNTMRDIRANHLYFAGLSIDPIRTAKLRITNSVDDDYPFKYKVTRMCIKNNQEPTSDPIGQSILDNALNDSSSSSSSNSRINRPVYIQERLIADYNTPPPLFTVEFPERGCGFVLEEKAGITQWYIQPLLDENNSSVPKDDQLLYYRNAQYGNHFFFALELFPIQWSMLALLRNLYKSAYKSSGYTLQRCHRYTTCEGHRHYTVSIFLAGVEDIPDPSSPKAMYTTIHDLCEDTKVMHIFETLAGGNLNDEFAITQLKWLGGTARGKFEMNRTYDYRTVRESGIKVKDWGWFGSGLEFWLLPLNLED